MKLCPIALDDSAETRALIAWLDRSGIQRTDFSTADVVWFMASSGILPPVEPPDQRCGILCTGSAAQLPQRWGWQSAPPEEGTIAALASPQGGTVLAMAARFMGSGAAFAVLQSALRYCARAQHDTQPVQDAALLPVRLPVLRAATGDTPSASGSAAQVNAPIMLNSPRVTASAGTLLGIRDVWLHPLRIVQAFSVAGFAARHGAAQSNVLQRWNELLDERVALPHELPAIVWQWTAGAARTLQLHWTVDLKLPPPCPAGLSEVSRWNTGDRWLLVQATDAAFSVLFCFDRTVRWHIRALPGALHVQVEARMDAGAACALCAVTVASHTTVQETAMRALDQPATLLRSRSAHAARLERDRVAITTPDLSANDGWRRAVLQIDGALAEVPGPGRAPVVLRTLEGEAYPVVDTNAALAIALSALALGDHVMARALIQYLAATQDQEGRIASECSTAGFCTRAADSGTVSFLRLIVRYFDCSGDIPFVRSHWPVVRAAADRIANSLGRGASQALSEVAAAIGEAADAARLKSAGDMTSPAANSALGWSGWREQIDQKAASWLEHAANLAPGNPEAAARLVADFTGGLLGWEPDASRNRARLSPAIPRAWSAFEVSNLRVGDSRIGLRYLQSGLSHTLVLTPLAGMVPVRVIFEPVISAPAISRVTVDGKPATLDLQRRADGWSVPMQIVLDHERTIVVDAAG